MSVFSFKSLVSGQFRLFPHLRLPNRTGSLVQNNMSTSTASDNLVVEHDSTTNKFFIKLGEAEAKLEYDVEQLDGQKVLNMWHTEVPPSLQGKGIAKILAKDAFDYVVKNKLKMRLTCTYLQKYLSDNAAKYEGSVM